MTNTNINIAEKYYKAMDKKDINELASYLHPTVKFSSPFAEINGKEAMVEALKAFLNFFNAVKIRAKFGSGDQVMLAYAIECWYCFNKCVNF